VDSSEKVYHKVRGVFAAEFPILLVCPKCGATLATPKHCKQEMHIEDVNEEKKLVCWMGTKCGEKPLPSHCGVPMTMQLFPSSTKVSPPGEGETCNVGGGGGGGGAISSEELKKRQQRLDKMDEELEKKHNSRSFSSAFVSKYYVYGAAAGLGALCVKNSFRSFTSMPFFKSRLPRNLLRPGPMVTLGVGITLSITAPSISQALKSSFTRQL